MSAESSPRINIGNSTGTIDGNKVNVGKSKDEIIEERPKPKRRNTQQRVRYPKNLVK